MIEGHPPSILSMTCHEVDAVGALSLVTASWQEPPPCTAEPVNDRVCVSPIAMVVLLDAS